MSSALVDDTQVPAPVVAAPRLNLPPIIFLAALWAWVIVAFSGYWKDFDQYSYGYFVPALAAYFIWRRLGLFASDHPSTSVGRSRGLTVAAILTALSILPLEYVRLALPASRWTVWVIALVAIGFSLAFAANLGGRPLARNLAFPLLFFLSAAPWFSFFEKNVTLGLMEYVAAIVTEILHLCGIQATAKGTLIAMRPGTLGIAEACSGIRSLQSGLMYALAVGELFLLPASRRVALVALTVLAGFLLNLFRTFTLAYQTDLHGLSVIDKIHDQIGLFTSLALPVIVWGLGKLLAEPEPMPSPDAESPGLWVRRRAAGAPSLLFALGLGVAAFLPCHIWIFYLDTSVARQTKPYFAPRFSDPLNAPSKMAPDVEKALDATIGGYVRRLDPALPEGRLDAYYLFWEPRKDNFNILWHHPERCMVGAGWKPNGPTREIELTLNGQSTAWLAFRFKNDYGQVLQIWGAWRNGVPVVGNKSVAKTSLKGLLAQLRIFSKGNSATEIVSVSLPYTGDTPPYDLAQSVINQVFDYTATPTP